jgi:predicted SnoaL-like aldol condensation-catalyzing enzyme
VSETNKGIAVAFYRAVIEGRVEDAFRLYAVPTGYRQHNPLIEDGKEGLRKAIVSRHQRGSRCSHHR